MRPFIPLLVIIGLACNNHTLQQDTKSSGGKQFFEFDQVIHYSTDVTEAKVEALITKGNLTKSEKYYSQIISGDYPVILEDIDTSKLVELSFKNRNLDTTSFSTLRQIFATRESTDGITMSCMPVYRDILVFVYKKEISGMAKICFGCHQYQFIGTKENTETFGSDDDYEILEQILK